MNVRAGLLVAGGFALLFLAACGDDDSPSLLARQVEASLDVTAKVTYEMTLDWEGTRPAALVSATITQGRWGKRWDSYASRGNKAYWGTFLDVADEEYACFRYRGLEPEDVPEGQLQASEEGACYAGDTRFEVNDVVLAREFDFRPTYREFLKETNELEWKVLPSRVIAGISADCYQFTMTDPTDICFSGDDILLMVDVRDPDGLFTLVALEVDRDVREADFALPYPVVDWPYCSDC